MSADFTENLIKGKIVETIFQQMFLETEQYHVYPTGYENTLPDIAHLKHHSDIYNILNQTRKTPDFIIVPNDRDEVYLVEVKYREHYDGAELEKISKEIHDKWEYSWLFLATRYHFHFESCWKIMEKHGNNMNFLPYEWVPQDIQDKYRSLLHKFLK